MKNIQETILPIEGYFVSLTRDTINGWYEIEIGIPKGWVFNETKDISCEIINENELGKLIKIFPKNNKVIVDDLFVFIDVIIETNKRIAEKEKEFTAKMEEMKGVLEKEAKKFYEELDELKENSFKNLTEKQSEEKIKKERKPKPIIISGTTN